jgi:hypothetical protein
MIIPISISGVGEITCVSHCPVHAFLYVSIDLIQFRLRMLKILIKIYVFIDILKRQGKEERGAEEIIKFITMR